MARLLAVLLGLLLLSSARASSLTVMTECGPVQGSVLPENNNVIAYLGVPYAAPPTGERRFQPPFILAQEHLCWNDTLVADEPGPVCLQKGGGGVTGSEDCLYINIWTPYLPNASHPLPMMPVLAYIHGGSLIEGCSYCIPNAQFNLASHGVVAVSFSYRLNVLGFLALDELSQQDLRGVSGNYGFLDQIAALQWVQRNIASFGGDPGNVLVWGQSSGGTSVLALVASPLARGLFSVAVSMSGSPNISVPLEIAEAEHAATYLPVSPCANATASSLYSCLMNASADDLVSSYPDAYWNPSWLFGLPEPNSTIAPLAIIDGVVLRYPLPLALASKEDANDVVLVLGNLAAEPDLAPADIVYNLSAPQFAFFLKDRLRGFSSKIAPGILNLYEAADYRSSQEQYDQIVADYGTICGNIDIAAIAAANFNSSVYSYIGTYYPVQHICDPLNSYCTQYPYHMMDMAMALQDGWFMNGTDYQFGDLVRSYLIDLAGVHALPPPWTPVPANGTSIPTTLLDLYPTTANDVRAAKCAFWKQAGWSAFWWQN